MLYDIIELNLNEISKETKIERIGFNTSEDALSWIFFSYFIKYNKTDILLKILNFDNDIVEDILFWGTSYNEPSVENKFRKKLIDVLEKLFCENKRNFTEPDIIIITKTKTIFIEVKYNSINKYEKNKNKIEKYLKNKYYSNEEEAKNSGLYELIRNWSIGSECSNDKQFFLLNIGLKNKFESKKEQSRINTFIKSLNHHKNFIRFNWEELLYKLEKENIDKSFYKEIEKRIYLDKTN